jgi:hypothetical protein
MCRNFITWCSRTWINNYIPFERHISWHKHIGYGLVPELVLHISGHVSNFYRLSTKPVAEINSSLGQNFKKNPSLADLWLFSIPGATGLLMVLVLGMMLWGASRRRGVSGGFEKFWFSHHLFVVFYALLVVHGTSSWLEPATTHWYLLPPALLYGMQRLTRAIKHTYYPCRVLEARHHPSNVLSLRFTKPAGVSSYRWAPSVADAL